MVYKLLSVSSLSALMWLLFIIMVLFLLFCLAKSPKRLYELPGAAGDVNVGVHLCATCFQMKFINWKSLSNTVLPPVCNLSNWLTLCPYSEEEPELGNLSVSETGWDGFQLTWTAADGAYENFVIQVQESDDPEETWNVTVPGRQHSVNITGLKANTPYNITLYGVIRGYRTKPLYVETTTGIFSSSLTAPFRCRQGHEPELLQLLDKACSLGLLCMGALNSLKLGWTSLAWKCLMIRLSNKSLSAPTEPFCFQECSFYPSQNGLFCSLYSLFC